MNELEANIWPLILTHGNAFGVGSRGGDVVILGAPTLARMTLGRAAAANLAAWLILVAGLGREDLAPIFEAHGAKFPA